MGHVEIRFLHGQKIRQIAAVQNDFFMGHVEIRFPHGQKICQIAAV